jgi:hypothetical protein
LRTDNFLKSIRRHHRLKATTSTFFCKVWRANPTRNFVAVPNRHVQLHFLCLIPSALRSKRMVRPTIIFVGQRTVAHTPTTTTAPCFTLSGLMVARDPSLALTTLLCTFTRISSIQQKFLAHAHTHDGERAMKHSEPRASVSSCC